MFVQKHSAWTFYLLNLPGYLHGSAGGEGSSVLAGDEPSGGEVSGGTSLRGSSSTSSSDVERDIELEQLKTGLSATESRINALTAEVTDLKASVAPLVAAVAAAPAGDTSTPSFPDQPFQTVVPPPVVDEQPPPAPPASPPRPPPKKFRPVRVGERRQDHINLSQQRHALVPEADHGDEQYSVDAIEQHALVPKDHEDEYEIEYDHALPKDQGEYSAEYHNFLVYACRRRGALLQHQRSQGIPAVEVSAEVPVESRSGSIKDKRFHQGWRAFHQRQEGISVVSDTEAAVVPHTVRDESGVVGTGGDEPDPSDAQAVVDGGESPPEEQEKGETGEIASPEGKDETGEGTEAAAAPPKTDAVVEWRARVRAAKALHRKKKRVAKKKRDPKIVPPGGCEPPEEFVDKTVKDLYLPTAIAQDWEKKVGTGTGLLYVFTNQVK